MNEVAAAVVRANAALADCLLAEVKQRDPAMRADIDLALASGATLEAVARFGETQTELAIVVVGPTGKRFTAASITSHHVAVN